MLEVSSRNDIIPMSESRSNLASYAARTSDGKHPLILTQNGHAAFAFVEASAFEEMRDKLVTHEDILVAEGEADWGETVSHEDFMKVVRPNRKKRTRRMRPHENQSDTHLEVTLAAFHSILTGTEPDFLTDPSPQNQTRHAAEDAFFVHETAAAHSRSQTGSWLFPDTFAPSASVPFAEAIHLDPAAMKCLFSGVARDVRRIRRLWRASP